MIRFIKILCLLSAVATGVIWSTTSQAQSHSGDLPATAWALESSGQYESAALAYREYLASKPPKSADRRHAKIKLPVLQEAILHGNGIELDLYISALNSRAAGDVQTSLALLERLRTEHPNSNLVDDALYLQAYITMMDNFDFNLAHNTFQQLRFAHPQSRYYDTALYSEAISQEQLGNRELAISKLNELRERHTGVSIAGVSWPRDNFVSRLWFDRSQARLDYLQDYQNTASTLVSLEPYGQYGFAWRAVISIDGQDFNLLLNQSQVTLDTKVVDVNGSALKSNDTNAFAGRIEGEPDSWARITIAENKLRGMISAYGKRIKLTPTETGGTLSDFNPLLLGDIDGNITTEPDHALYPPKSEDEFNNYIRNIRIAAAPAIEQGVVGLTATIGVVIDSKFNSYHGGRGAQEARAILNTTDGVFREEFGLALKIDTIVVIDDPDNDPMNMGRVTMEEMMRKFSEFRKNSTDLSGDISMATLFSGNKNSDAALGLAWIGSVCRTDGYDVSVVSPYRHPALLSTHEIGHTLGAQHDSETACNADSNHIMWPYLSASTRRSFSSCSKESVQQFLTNGNCFIDTMDIGIGLEVNETQVSVTTINNDRTRYTSGSSVTISSTSLSKITEPPSNCRSSSDKLVCTIGPVAPSEAKEITLDFSTPLDKEDTVTAMIKPIGFMDSETDNNSMLGDTQGNIQVIYDTSVNNNPGSPSGARFSNESGSGALSKLDLLLGSLILLLLWPGEYIRKSMKIRHV